jgi:hypothetical protein
MLLMVQTRALQIWKLHVEELPSGRSSPMVGRLESLIRKLLAADVRPSGRCAIPDEALKQERFPCEIFGKSCCTVVHPDGAQVYFA